MKLLFDQNLSFKLVGRLADLFPNCLHVRDAGLKDADDSLVWEYAKQHAYIIVSKDSDFHQRSFVFGAPPRVIWVALGKLLDVGCRTRIEKAFCGDARIFSRPRSDISIIVIGREYSSVFNLNERLCKAVQHREPRTPKKCPQTAALRSKRSAKKTSIGCASRRAQRVE